MSASPANLSCSPRAVTQRQQAESLFAEARQSHPDLEGKGPIQRDLVIGRRQPAKEGTEPARLSMVVQREGKVSAPVAQRVVTWKGQPLGSAEEVREVLQIWVPWMNAMCGKVGVPLDLAIEQLLAGKDFNPNDEDEFAKAIVEAAASVPEDKRERNEPIEEVLPEAPVVGARPVALAAPRLSDNMRLEVPDLTSETSYLSVGDAAVQNAARPDPRTIFIGEPTIDDVHQGALGTCYFLSNLLLLVHADISHVVNRLIRYDAGSQTAVVSFWYRSQAPRTDEGQEGPWATEEIRVDLRLALVGSQLKGAKLRREQIPSDFGEQGGDQGATYYRTALWVPLLEKAYAIFAQRFGRFGHAGSGSQESGYDVIHKGARTPHMLLRVIYGPALAERGEESLPFGDELDDLQGDMSRNVLSRLVELNAARRNGKKAFLTAGLGEQQGKQGLFIEKDHVYAVMAVGLNKADGSDAASAADVDPSTSSVVLRNPHRRLKGEKFKTESPGELRMTLKQFFVNFGTLSWAIVEP